MSTSKQAKVNILTKLKPQRLAILRAMYSAMGHLEINQKMPKEEWFWFSSTMNKEQLAKDVGMTVTSLRYHIDKLKDQGILLEGKYMYSYKINMNYARMLDEGF